MWNMLRFIPFLIVLTVASDVKVTGPIGRKLGDECIPGTCSSSNSNCKWQGSSFKCVCKEKYIQVNSTHCGRHLTNVDEDKCKECLEKDSLCLDYDNDAKTDDCWCPKNETCGVISQSKQTLKTLKNVEVAMILLDVTNNRPILDGSTVFVSDQVLIDVKATVKDPSVSMAIENCSVTALTNADDIFLERIDLIKKGCTVHNEVLPFNIKFRSISETHFESNVFEIFKLRSSSLALISCWVQFCVQKSKCVAKMCTETSSLTESHPIYHNHVPHGPHALMRNLMENDERYQHAETSLFRDTGVRILVEDPYGVQPQLSAKSQKTEGSYPSSIELEIKTKSLSGVVKTVLISVIAIVFAIVVSVCSIIIYRSCTRDQMMSTRNGQMETPVSICQPSEECKYDMTARNLDESFFQNPVEPLAAQSHGSRW